MDEPKWSDWSDEETCLENALHAGEVQQTESMKDSLLQNDQESSYPSNDSYCSESVKAENQISRQSDVAECKNATIHVEGNHGLTVKSTSTQGCENYGTVHSLGNFSNNIIISNETEPNNESFSGVKYTDAQNSVTVSAELSQNQFHADFKDAGEDGTTENKTTIQVLSHQTVMTDVISKEIILADSSENTENDTTNGSTKNNADSSGLFNDKSKPSSGLKSKPKQPKTCAVSPKMSAHHTNLNINQKRKRAIKVKTSAQKFKRSGSSKVSLSKDDKKHFAGIGRKKIKKCASKFSLKNEGKGSKKDTNKEQSNKLNRKKKQCKTDVKGVKLCPNLGKRKRFKRKHSESLSSDDDVPLSVLRNEHTSAAKNEDSDDTYKASDTEINSTDSECFTNSSHDGKNKPKGRSGMKRNGGNAYARVSEKKPDRGRDKEGKKKKVAEKESQAKKIINEGIQANADGNVKQVKQTNTNADHSRVKETVLFEGQSSEQQYIMLKDQTDNLSYLAMIQQAKEESKEEEEKRKLIELQHENRLDQLLFSNGFIRKTVIPDGNCFFEAASMTLLGDYSRKHLRQELCQHLEENVEEYIGFLLNRNSNDDDLTFLKAYFKQIETLRQNGYWSNRAGNFLPLALANWSHRTVRIYSSKPEQPVIEVQPTLGHLVESEPVCLAYISSPGISEHYDGCIKCSTLSQALPSETHPKMQPDENQSLLQNGSQNSHNETELFTAIQISITEADKELDTGPVTTPRQVNNCEKNTIPGSSEANVDAGTATTCEEVESQYIADPLDVQNGTFPDKVPYDNTCNTDNSKKSTLEGNHVCSPKKLTPRKSAKFITPVKRKLARKRKSTPENWKKNIRKRLRLSGQEYKNSTGKMIEEKALKPPCKSCRFKCTSKFSEENRKQIFNSFWSLASYERQKDFVCSCVMEKKTKTYLDENDDVKEKRRMVCRSYTLENEGQKFVVCKKFFSATLSIGEAYINHALSNKTGGRFHSTENRGRHIPHNKTHREKLELVREHITSFPKVDGHYVRKDSNRQFLGPELNISRMYELYQEKCLQNSDEPVSKAVYRRTFNEEFNFSFHVPKKDQCNTCTRYNQALSEGTLAADEIMAEYEKHQSRKVRARQEKENDKETAKTTANICVATFDLQSVLYTPCTLVSLMYYMRKLCCYNLSVYNLSNQAGTCYVWSETEGGRGSCEVATCLRLHLLSLPLNIDHVILYSDACGGQNRNQIIATSLLDAVTASNNIKLIDHKFLESGHTHMECDSMHAGIEFAKKKTAIYVPSQWDTVIRLARRKKPYTVVPIKHGDIIDFKHMKTQKIKNVKITAEGKRVNWTKIRWMRFTEDCPDTFFIKYDYDEEFQSIRVSGSKRARNADVPHCDVLPRRYKSKLPISAAKKKDLLSLCKSGVIPSEYHEFYKSLPSHQSVRDRLPEPDILETNSDNDTDAE